MLISILIKYAKWFVYASSVIISIHTVHATCLYKHGLESNVILYLHKPPLCHILLYEVSTAFFQAAYAGDYRFIKL